MANAEAGWRLSHAAVEAAVRALASTNLTTTSDAMLRAFLAFKAIDRSNSAQPVDSSAVKSVVKELFEVLQTPRDVSDKEYSGTLALRGIGGRPRWLRNDSYRGSYMDYAGPSSPGRFLFEEENWHRPMLKGAVRLVAETLSTSGYDWPPRDAVAAIVLRNETFDAEADWELLAERARDRFGLSPEEWNSITSDPALDVSPFGGEPWEQSRLSPSLRPTGFSRVQISEQRLEEMPPRVASQVERVLEALGKHGDNAIIALAGVPGTSKSYVARLAARSFAAEGCLREIQFHPGYTYEEFIEGPRYGDNMEVEVVLGAFLELNKRALKDSKKQYVLLVEELTRADLPRVLGELLTYIEYRGDDDCFTTMYNRKSLTRIAPNIAILATYNPADQSAIGLDAALIRRLRILDFPPSTEILREMLSDNDVESAAIAALIEMFDACADVAGDRYSEIMPFGHALFASIHGESDLYELWHETIKRILVRPYAAKHELFEVILEHYPWHEGPHVTVG